MLSHNNPIPDLWALIQKAPSQEKLIISLRGYDFRFMMRETLAEKGIVNIRDHDEKYQWMVRVVNESIGKYDLRLVVGIKILGKKLDRVKLYAEGEYQQTFKIPWEKQSGYNFKKVTRKHSFPDELTYDERRAWRKEHRKMLAIQAKGLPFYPSAFYSKWAPLVTFH